MSSPPRPQPDIGAEIIRRIIPQARGVRLHRVGSPNYRGQRLIGDLEQLGCVLGLIDGLGDDYSDRLADKTGLIGRHRVVSRRDRIEASNPDGDIGSAHKACSVRYRREPVGDIVTAGKHREHCGRCERCCFVDRSNTRMGMGRAHDHGMR